MSHDPANILNDDERDTSANTTTVAQDDTNDLAAAGHTTVTQDEMSPMAETASTLDVGTSTDTSGQESSEGVTGEEADLQPEWAVAAGQDAGGDEEPQASIEAQAEQFQEVPLANLGTPDGETSPSALPMALVETLADAGGKPRRNKKKDKDRQTDGQDETSDDEVESRQASTSAQHLAAEDGGHRGDVIAPAEEAQGDGTDPANEDDPEWRAKWPKNELIIRGVLEASTAQSPATDGVNRIRTTISVTEIDPDEPAEVGIVARIPVLILPLAAGLDPIMSDIFRARRAARSGNRQERLEPIVIEARGISKRIQDRDTRFAHERRTTLMGLEISAVKRIDKKSGQYSRWRGRGTVANTRPYDVGDDEYLRVTLNVPSARQKTHLRGATAQIDKVDVLVRKDHPHYPRFRRLGQELLVEAEATSQTSLMREDHPDLEGLEDQLRQRLQTLRQPLVIVTMGEFPDEAAEAQFHASLDTRQSSGHQPSPTRRRKKRKNKGLPGGEMSAGGEDTSSASHSEVIPGR